MKIVLHEPRSVKQPKAVAVARTAADIALPALALAVAGTLILIASLALRGFL